MSTHETPGDAHPTGVASLNLGLSDELKTSFSNIVAIKRPLIKNQEILDPYWLGGFASGEACFIRREVYIYKSKTNLGKAVQLKFYLAQHEPLAS
jgi:hypothetical protein